MTIRHSAAFTPARSPATRAKARPATSPPPLQAPWRKDVDALIGACRLSLVGLRILGRRQMAMVDEAVGEWRTVVVVMSQVGPRVSVRHVDKLVVASCQLALADIRELAALAVQSQRIAFHAIGHRISERCR